MQWFYSLPNFLCNFAILFQLSGLRSTKLSGDIVDIFGVSCYKPTKSTYCNLAQRPIKEPSTFSKPCYAKRTKCLINDTQYFAVNI